MGRLFFETSHSQPVLHHTCLLIKPVPNNLSCQLAHNREEVLDGWAVSVLSRLHSAQYLEDRTTGIRRAKRMDVIIRPLALPITAILKHTRSLLPHTNLTHSTGWQTRCVVPGLETYSVPDVLTGVSSDTDRDL